jgi:hypothetical protein
MTDAEIVALARKAGITVRPGTMGVECWIENLRQLIELVIPDTPYEARADAEKRAYAAGWWAGAKAERERLGAFVREVQAQARLQGILGDPIV